MREIRKAVIPAAGWGTRCLPASKAVPKEMMPVVDKPAIQYAVEEAAEAGITDILIITSRNKSPVEDHFDRNVELETFLHLKGKDKVLDKVRRAEVSVNISYTRQKEQKGLGHAVSLAREFAGGEPFAVLLPDDLIVAEVPCLKQMVDIFQKRPGPVIAVMEVSREEVSKYGVVRPVRLGANLSVVKDMVEKPSPQKAPSLLAVVGRYIITPAIFDCLDRVKPGAGGEIQLTDALKMLAQIDEVYAYKFHGTRFDVGTIEGLIRANIHVGLSHPEFGGEVEKEIIKVLDSRLEVG